MFDFKTANFTNRLARGICILEVSHRAVALHMHCMDLSFGFPGDF